MRTPATAMDRPLMAPSTSPICRALLVPTAWAEVPMPTPFAMGSVMTKVMGFLVGQVMREMKGKADPKMVNELVQQKLSQ